jgi:hypothetical protein
LCSRLPVQSPTVLLFDGLLDLFEATFHRFDPNFPLNEGTLPRLEGNFLHLEAMFPRNDGREDQKEAMLLLFEAISFEFGEIQKSFLLIKLRTHAQLNVKIKSEFRQRETLTDTRID